MTIGLNMKSPGKSGAFFVSGRVPRRSRRALSRGHVFYRLFGPAVFPAFETGCLDRFGSFYRLCPVCVSGTAFPAGGAVPFRLYLPGIVVPADNNRRFPGFLFPGAAFPAGGAVVSRRYLLRRITMQLGTPRSPSWSKRLLS